MKKIIAFLLLISLTLCSVIGCNSEIADANADTTNKDDIIPENCYKVTVTGQTEKLKGTLEPYYQAGTVVQIMTPVVIDSSVYVFMNNQMLENISSGSGYCEYFFTMPNEDVTIHLTNEQFYGRDEIDFSELFYITSFSENITKVALQTYNNTTPYGLVETRYSYKAEDIEKFNAILDQKLVIATREDYYANTQRSEYYYYHKSDNIDFSLNFSSNTVIKQYFNHSKFYKFKDSNYVLPTIDAPDLITYSFHSTNDNTIKKYGDDDYSSDYSSMHLVEFVPYEGEALDIEPKFYIDSKEYGIINLLTETIFELNGEYYEIISGAQRWPFPKAN